MSAARTVLLVAASAVLAPMALAQQQAQPSTHRPIVEAQGLTAGGLRGQPVITEHGEPIGYIDEFVRRSDGQIDAVVRDRRQQPFLTPSGLLRAQGERYVATGVTSLDSANLRPFTDELARSYSEIAPSTPIQISGTVPTEGATRERR